MIVANRVSEVLHGEKSLRFFPLNLAGRFQ
jgi:hypothetical protein